MIPPDRQDEEPEILDRIRRGDHVAPYETVRRRKDGCLLDVSLTVSPLKNTQGKVIGASKIARDITEKRRQEERRQLLVNELNHRVKNTLATVQSLAAQTFRGETHTPLFRQFESRLVALSRAHDVLTREDWEGIYLQDLITETVGPICIQPEQRFQISGPSLRLRPKLALSLSMAIHELCTNAAKHGALTNETGRIEIQWDVQQLDSSHCLHLRWQEMQGPKVEPPRQKGFGSRLLEHALRREFDARVALSFASSGVVCEITIPLT